MHLLTFMTPNSTLLRIPEIQMKIIISKGKLWWHLMVKETTMILDQSRPYSTHRWWWIVEFHLRTMEFRALRKKRGWYNSLVAMPYLVLQAKVYFPQGLLATYQNLLNISNLYSLQYSLYCSYLKHTCGILIGICIGWWPDTYWSFVDRMLKRLMGAFCEYIT